MNHCRLVKWHNILLVVQLPFGVNLACVLPGTSSIKLQLYHEVTWLKPLLFRSTLVVTLVDKYDPVLDN